MKRIFACAAIMVFFGVVALSAQGEEGSESEQGKKLYQEKCQMCHGEKGEGNGPMSSFFSPRPVDFTKPEFWNGNPDEKIKNAIQNGYKNMPQIDLTPNQIEKIISYISHAFKR